MKAAALRKAWGPRAPRERMVIAVLAAVLGAALYVLLLYSADRARGQLRTSVVALRTQAALLEQQAAEHERRRGALTRIDAPDADHVRLGRIRCGCICRGIDRVRTGNAD